MNNLLLLGPYAGLRFPPQWFAGAWHMLAVGGTLNSAEAAASERHVDNKTAVKGIPQ
jgi:hypothetical protein